MTEHDLIRLGLPALFLISLLASTLLPLGSEWLLAALIAGGGDPAAATLVATAGNTLGALTTYAIGIGGSAFLLDRVLKIDPRRMEQAQGLLNRFGGWVLLFSWVPVIGDPLCLAAGIFRMRPLLFLIPTLLGKGARYALVAWAAGAVV